MNMIPVSVVIPTADRPEPLARTVQSLLASTTAAAEFVFVDASAGRQTADAVNALFAGRPEGPRAIFARASIAGAAAQRNQALALSTQPFILFCDDDIVAEPDCLERLWRAVQSDDAVGGANAIISNQSYSRPGRMLRMVLAAFGEPERGGYAGRIVGPAIPFLPAMPEAGAAAPDTVPVQWLNLGCTLYRRDRLPDPPFDPFFSGYSIGEDVALSLRVAKKGGLVNVPAARVYHDSQPGSHKSNAVVLSRMESVNRHYVMTRVMSGKGWRDYANLILWECAQLGICALQQRGGALFWRLLRGKLLGLFDIVRGRHRGNPA